MANTDRRAGRERRSVERFDINIEVEWEGLIGRKNGTISDISPVGCFILCSGEVEDGENVKIFFPLTDGRKIQFWGEVSNHIFEIGFAIKFIELSDAQKEFLEVFVDTLRVD
ncbi:MAG: PilZ domain-containing protein [Pyrinomonadaceae bacterium]|nr:PilZ domain-containing protein [Pyrinomonadaceae bacterium]